MHIEQMQVVKAPREQVFQAWNDVEAWPKWQTLFTSVTVTKRDGNTKILDTEINFRGRKARRIEKHVLTPPEKVQVEGEMQGITNTTEWKFDPVPEGTGVTAVFEARLPLRMKILAPLVKRQIQAMGHDWLKALAKYVEAK